MYSMKIKTFITILMCLMIMFCISEIVLGGDILTVYGSLQTSFNSTPDVGSLTFTAYITTRTSEVKTQSSGGCGYDSNSQWWVQCGNFPTPWSDGEILRVIFTDDDTDETKTINITLDIGQSPSQNTGTTTLIAPSETMNSPSTPSGPSTGFKGQSLSFSTGGGSSSLGHPLEYQFDWGDGSQSGWGNGSESHTYSTTNTFLVKARVRCEYHTNKESSWSSTKSVTVSKCTLNVSISPGGSGSVTKNPNAADYDYGQSVQLTASGSGNFSFSHWSVDLSGSDNPKSITMNGNKNVTANFAEETVSVPDTPDGPTSGFKGQSLNFLTGGSVNNMGHSVEYQFDWGDGTSSSWVASGSASHSYTTASTFQIRAKARCQSHTGVVSGWSGNHSVMISTASLTINVSPGGTGTVSKNPDKGGYDWNESVQLTANPAAGYGFDHWGGDLTGTDNPKSITMNGNKSVTAYMVEETVSTPTQPSGPSSGFKEQNLSYTTGGASSSLGHSVEYQFDWGDGAQSGWGAATGNHTYTATGSFSVKTRARCQDHTDKISDWSQVRSVNISLCSLAITISPTGGGSVSRNPNESGYDYNESVQLTATPADARYQFGSWSGGLGGSTNPQNITMSGNKSVTANFNKETVSTPNTPNGPSLGMVGDNLTFTTGGSASSFGHSVEYRFNWGDGNYSTWGAATRSHSYAATGTFQVRAQARCQTHNDIESAWSGARTVSISTYTLTVNVSPGGAGSVSRNPDKPEYNPNESVQLTANPTDNSYRFDFWSGDLNGSSNPETIIMNGDKTVTANFEQERITKPGKPEGPSEGYMGQTLIYKEEDAKSTFNHALEYRFNWGDGSMSNWGHAQQSHSFDTTGVYQVVAQARCKTHPDVISLWSTDLRYVWIYACSVYVSIDPEETGRVEKSPDRDRYAYQDTVQLTAISNSGYAFNHWSGDTSGTDNVMILVVDTVVTNLTAHFTENSETVSIPDTPTGPDTGIMGQPLTFNTGGSVSNFGNSVEYQFDWGDGNLSDWGGSTGIHTYLTTGILSVKSRARSQVNTSIVSDWSGAHGIAIGGYTLSMSMDPLGTGSVAANPAKALYSQDDIVQITATPAAGYLFDYWSGDAAGTDNPVQIEMSSDKIITAHFTEIQKVTLTINVDPVGSGTVVKMPDQMEFFVGDTVIVTAVPATGFGFTGWSGDLSGSANPAQIVMDGNKTITANFSQNPKYTLMLNIDPIGGGTASKAPDKIEYDPGDTVMVTATPADGYAFNGWSGDLSGSVNPAQIVMDGNKTVTSNFSQNIKYTLTVNIDPIGGGAVSQAPDKVEYDQGDTVTVTATPAAGYTFSGWSGDLAGSNNPEQIVMDGNKVLTAHFASTASYILYINIDPAEGGSVLKSPDMRSYGLNEVVTLTAQPSNGFSFDYWSGDLTGTINPSQLTMDSEKTVTAHFLAVVDTVTVPSKPTGPVRGYRGQMLAFSTANSKSSLGEAVQYQFDKGDATLSVWGDSTQTYAYAKIGNITYRARARSSADTTAISDWSESSTIFISSCHMLVASDPGQAGEVLLDPQKNDYDYGEVVDITGKANSGYQFSHWNDDLSDSLYMKTVIMNSDKTFVAHFKIKTSVAKSAEHIAGSYALGQNYPNPFNPETAIQFQISESEFVNLTVYNMSGQHVQTLVNEIKSPGWHTVLWRADDFLGNQVPSGIYFYTLRTDAFQQTNKMILMR